MSIKARGNSIPLRGGSSGGSSTLTVGNEDDTSANELSTTVRKIIWNTADLGFYASVDADDEGVIWIGTVPDFLDPITWSTESLTSTYISTSDASEVDAFETDNKEGTLLPSTHDSSTYLSSTTGRGFGEDSNLNITIEVGGIETINFDMTCDEEGTTTQDGVSVTISNYAEDGDGSAYQGSLYVELDNQTVVGMNDTDTSYLSGVVSVTCTFTEQYWGNTQSVTFTYFYDHTDVAPTVEGSITIAETTDSLVTKEISGILYYTTGSKFDIDVGDITSLLEDCCIQEPLSMTTQEFAIENYTECPYVDDSNWTDFTGTDTDVMSFSDQSVIDISDTRIVGSSNVQVTVADLQNSSESTSNSMSVCIDTYSDTSTALLETFNAETYRLQGDYSTSWDSTDLVTDGHAVVFDGKACHGSDLYTIDYDGTVGSDGSAANLSSYSPIVSANNPDYSGHGNTAVYFRAFTGVDGSSASMTMNVETDAGLDTDLGNGLKIYIWKLDSIDDTSNNLTLPDEYDPDDPETSKANSLWAHSSYNFSFFDDGVTQSDDGAGCLVSRSGSVLSLTFASYNVVEGILVRFDIESGTKLKEVSCTFD